MTKVLIFEDELSLKPVMTKILSPYCQEILWQQHGDRPEVMLKHDWDLVISDYDLRSRASGMDLWLASHQSRPGRPFVLMSGYPGDVFQKLLNMGVPAPAFLLKPFTSFQCRQMIESILKKAA